MPEDGRELVGRVRPRLILGMAAANVVGGIVVFVLARWVLPLPPVPDPHTASRENLIAFAAYLLVSVPAGTAWSFRLHLPVQRWLLAGREPSPQEQRQALLTPVRQLRVHAAIWGLGGVLFVALNFGRSSRIALDIAITSCSAPPRPARSGTCSPSGSCGRSRVRRCPHGPSRTR